MSKSINIVLRELEIKDLEDYFYLNHPLHKVLKNMGAIIGKQTPYVVQTPEYWTDEYVDWERQDRSKRKRKNS